MMFSTLLIALLVSQLGLILLSRLLNFFKPVIMLAALGCTGIITWKLLNRAIELMFPALHSALDALLLLVLILEILILILTPRKKVSFSLLAVLSFCGLLFTIFSFTPLVPQTNLPPEPLLRNPLLFLHVIPAFAGIACFALAFASSIVHILSANTGRSEYCYKLAYYAVLVGFPLYSVGAMIFGAIWAQLSWGSWWNWDPKEVWALVTWLIYALYLHQRYIGKRDDKFFSWMLIAGFLLSIFTFLGTGYVYASMHDFL